MTHSIKMEDTFDVEDEIKRKLDEIETAKSVKVLYACESGSRAWGFASKDSDYDVRFVYMRKPDWYLSVNVEHRRDVVELPIEGDLDINGWDLRKTMKLLAKSNPALLEWFSSDIVYKEAHGFASEMRTLMKDYYSPRAGFYHYLNMAKNNYREYLRGEKVKLKKYFYVLRPVLCMRWIESHKSIPPLNFETLVKRTVSNDDLLASIAELLSKKCAGFESDYAKPITLISDFLDSELSRLAEVASGLPTNKPNLEKLDGHFLSVLKSDVWG